MKSLKQRGKKQVKGRNKVKTAKSIFMSMNLPANVIKGVNRKMREAS